VVHVRSLRLGSNPHLTEGRRTGVVLPPQYNWWSSKRPTVNWLKRRGCCSICCAGLDRPLLPLSRVGLQRYWQLVGIISLSHVCLPCCPDWSFMPCVRRAWSLVTASKTGPVAITSTNHIWLTAGCYSSIALTLCAYTVVHASVIKDEPRHLRGQHATIEGLENKSEFECFIHSSNFQTSFNISILDQS